MAGKVIDEKKAEDGTKSSRESVKYWLKWINAAKAAAKNHWEVASEAWAEYDYSKKSEGGYPVYKTSVDKLESAIFAKGPDVRSRRNFGIDDEMALTMTLINDRLAENLILDGDALEAWEAARGDFVHAAKACVQVVYSEDTEMYRVPLTKVGEGKEATYVEAEKGEAYEGEVTEEEMSDGSVSYSGSKERPVEGTQKVRLAPCLFDEILHTPEAKTNAEITEMAYKFCIPYEEAEELFNPEGSLTLPYKTVKSYEDSSRSDSDDEKSKSPGRVLEGWEIHCKISKNIYWVSEDFADDFLQKSGDTNGLRKFFPSTPIITMNKGRKSLYPSPAWTYLRSTAKQLDKLYSRIFDLVDAIERKAVVYGASDALIKALNSPGLRYVAAGKMMDILEKGGLQELIQFIPVKELVESLTETMQLEEHFKNNFSEFFHLPEILRGQSDPHQSATQSEILVDEAHDTFETIKDKFTKMVRDSVELMLDLAYRFYSDQQIAEIVGYEYMQRGTPPVPPTQPSQDNPEGDPGAPAIPGHYERFSEALQRLRDDKQRLIRIDFETDSTSFRDDARDIERAKAIGDATIQGLKQISDMESPLVEIATDMLLSILDSMGGTTQTEDMIRKISADLKKIKDNPAPPAPDYEQLKLQIKSSEVEIKGQKVALEAQQSQAKLGLEAQSIGIESMKAEVKALESQSRIQIAQFESQFNAQLERALAQMEQQRIDIEKYKAELQAQETLLEEMRLRQDSDSEHMLQMREMAQAIQGDKLTAQPQAPAPQIITLPSSEPPNIHLNVHMPEPGKRTARIQHPDGTVSEISVSPNANSEIPTGGL